MDRHYFDWAATSPPQSHPPILSIPFGNPSSSHAEGRRARETLENARTRCAQALGVHPECLYFTSGGTEGNALVLQSLLTRPVKPSLAISAVEHPSVTENALVLKKLGIPLCILKAGKDGRVNSEEAAEQIRAFGSIKLASLMLVNNETGAIMDLEGLRYALDKQPGPPVHIHCDAVQGIGKVAANLLQWGIDSAVISAHKLGGPRGIGLLYLRKALEPLTKGGGQEGGIRPGTENVAGAVALANCLEARLDPANFNKTLQAARIRWARLIRALRNSGGCTLIPEDREEDDPRYSPYILQAAFDGIPGEVMVRALDNEGIACSTGSACSSKHSKRPILAAMGIDEERAVWGIRFSQGWTTTDEDIDALVGAVMHVREKLGR